MNLFPCFYRRGSERDNTADFSDAGQLHHQSCARAGKEQEVMKVRKSSCIQERYCHLNLNIDKIMFD